MDERFASFSEPAFVADNELHPYSKVEEEHSPETAATLFKDFFSLSAAEEAELALRIGLNKGLVRVIIHPFYYTNTTPDEAGLQIPDNKERVSIVENGTRRIIEKSTVNSPPVFVIEERGVIDDTRGKLTKEIEGSQTPVYFIPSQSGVSTPDLPLFQWGTLNIS